jgi:hypothetical protein
MLQAHPKGPLEHSILEVVEGSVDPPGYAIEWIV